MNFKIFRHYDIRGVVGKDFEAADAWQIGAAIGAFFRLHNSDLKTIVVGRDLRATSPEIFKILTQSFCKQGFDVLDVGVCPTPVISAWVKKTVGAAGVMITASHNPNTYNGIKIYLNALGGQVWGENIQKIARLLSHEFVLAEKSGQIITDMRVKQDYFSILNQDFSILRGSDLKIGIDCLGGAAQDYAEEIVKNLGLKNAFFINNSKKLITQPDPTMEENLLDLKQLIKQEKLDLGVAFDGDADRVIFLDQACNFIDGDKLNAIFCRALLAQNPKAKFVLDVKTSDVVFEVIAKNDGQFFESPTGNPLVQKMAQNVGAVFCGEASCHFTFFDSGVKVDDGIYAWLRLLKLLIEQKISLFGLSKTLEMKFSTPEIILKYGSEAIANQCIESVKNAMILRGAVLSDLDGLKVRMSGGWGLIRKSNTQPILSLRFEAGSQEYLNQIKRDFVKAMTGLIDKSELELLID